MNVRPQSSQQKGRSPVCTRRCTFNESSRTKRLGQKSQAWGLTPLCTSICLARSSGRKNDFLQPACEQRCGRSPRVRHGVFDEQLGSGEAAAAQVTHVILFARVHSDVQTQLVCAPEPGATILGDMERAAVSVSHQARISAAPTPGRRRLVVAGHRIIGGRHFAQHPEHGTNTSRGVASQKKLWG